jgi:MFS family permease
MLTVLKLMLTEEYRLHVSYSSARVFFSMPAYVFAIAFFFTATLPLMEGAIPVGDMLLFTNAGVFVYGLSVGAFGFLGKTYLERRYGRSNFLVAMPFLLPLTFRQAYASMYLRDVIFYITLILVPGLGGVLVASVVAHYHLSSVLVAFTAVSLSFLLGISFSFLASVIYLRSKATFVIIMLAFLAMAIAYGVFAIIPLEYLLPSWGFQVNLKPLGDDQGKAAFYFLVSVVVSLVMTSLAVISVTEAPLGKTPRIKESFPRYHAAMNFARSFQSLLAKELSDMARSGGASKMLLAYVVPLLLLSFTTWYVNNGLAIPVGFNTVFYAAMVGSFGIMLYSWIANVDAVDYLETLPVSVPQVIKAKLLAFFLLTLFISTGFVVGISLANHETQLLWLALPVLYITTAFMTIATAYLTGLSPNSVLFNPGVMTRFMAISLLPDLCITILSFSLSSDPLLAAAGIAIVCFALLTSTFFLYRGLESKFAHAAFF